MKAQVVGSGTADTTASLRTRVPPYEANGCAAPLTVCVRVPLPPRKLLRIRSENAIMLAQNGTLSIRSIEALARLTFSASHYCCGSTRPYLPTGERPHLRSPDQTTGESCHGRCDLLTLSVSAPVGASCAAYLPARNPARRAALQHSHQFSWASIIMYMFLLIAGSLGYALRRRRAGTRRQAV